MHVAPLCVSLIYPQKGWSKQYPHWILCTLSTPCSTQALSWWVCEVISGQVCKKTNTDVIGREPVVMHASSRAHWNMTGVTAATIHKLVLFLLSCRIAGMPRNACWTLQTQKEKADPSAFFDLAIQWKVDARPGKWCDAQISQISYGPQRNHMATKPSFTLI